MNWEEYIVENRRTRPPFMLEAGTDQVLANVALGLAGETGEFADLIKKWLYQGHDLDVLDLVAELGDMLWYAALALDKLGITLDEVLEINAKKLRRRYPEGFSVELSKNRGGELE